MARNRLAIGARRFMKLALVEGEIADVVGKFVAAGLKVKIDKYRGLPTIAVVNNDGDLVAGLIHSYAVNDEKGIWLIELTAYRKSPYWLSAKMMRQLSQLWYNQMGVERVQILVKEDNEAPIRLALKWGFEYEGLAKKGWDRGHNAKIYGMTRETCRFLEDS